MTVTTKPRRMYLLSFALNLAAGSLLLAPLLFWGEEIFLFVLGNNWGDAGRYASILVPFTVVSFAVSNVSTVFDVLRKNQYELGWQVLYLVQSVFLLYLCHTASLSLEELLFWFSIHGIAMYVGQFLMGYLLLTRNSRTSR